MNIEELFNKFLLDTFKKSITETELKENEVKQVDTKDYKALYEESQKQIEELKKFSTREVEQAPAEQNDKEIEINLQELITKGEF